MSPSARREWIEIQFIRLASIRGLGLPLRGGSGLKCLRVVSRAWESSLPLRGGSGLKYKIVFLTGMLAESPSARREWIEMTHQAHVLMDPYVSPSARREWIEILKCGEVLSVFSSPSARREWIEIAEG